MYPSWRHRHNLMGTLRFTHPVCSRTGAGFVFKQTKINTVLQVMYNLNSATGFPDDTPSTYKTMLAVSQAAIGGLCVLCFHDRYRFCSATGRLR